MRPIIMLILATILSTMPVYAADVELGDVEVVYDDEELEPTEVSENTAPADTTAEGEEIEVISALNAAYSFEGACEIDAKAVLPENFGLNCYLNIHNNTDGKTYQLPLYKENSYKQRIYVTAGDYVVTEVSVFDDVTGMYPMTYPADFTVSSGDTHTLEVTLMNFDEIEQVIQEKKEANQEVQVQEPEQGIKEIEPVIAEVESDFEVSYNGASLSRIGVKGKQTAAFDIAIKINNGSAPGEMSVLFSTDKGKTWSEPVDIPLDGFKRIPETGLTAEFVTSKDGGFIPGEIYTLYIPDPQTSLDITGGSGNSPKLKVTSIDPDKHVFDILEESGAIIKIKINRGGPAGKAVYSLSIDGGNTYGEQTLIPEDKTIVIDDLGVICTFEAGGDFRKGDIYSASAKRETYLKVIIFVSIILSIVLILLIYGYIKIMSHMPKKSEYQINVYKPYGGE